MDESLPIDTVTLIDDDKVEREFEVLDFIENSQGRFYALMPRFEIPDVGMDNEEIYFIFKIVEEDGEEQLLEVTDKDLLNDLSKQFEGRIGEIH